MRSLIKGILGRAGYGLMDAQTLQRLRTEKPISLDNFLDLYFALAPRDIFFVQIGAADGKLHDPIYEYVTRYQLHGVVVEPQYDTFKVLEKNYAPFPVTCVQAAIADKSGFMTLWTVKRDSLLYGGDYVKMGQKASFNRATVEKTISKKLPPAADPADFVEPMTVRTLSFEDLLGEAQVHNFDLLQIDAEGYDWEILKTVDLGKYSPQIINFESNRLSPEDRAECEAFLTGYGYKFFNHGIDTCAYKV